MTSELLLIEREEEADTGELRAGGKVRAFAGGTAAAETVPCWSKAGLA
ncbi:MAG: hypothetical protein H0X28_04245 [Solirubrobacterales bacterium]|nr:hypothetical protein [Solirubrobacterales bacterium]